MSFFDESEFQLQGTDFRQARLGVSTGEVIAKSFRDAELNATRVGFLRALRESYNERIDEFERRTGRRPENPVDAVYAPPTARQRGGRAFLRSSGIFEPRSILEGGGVEDLHRTFADVVTQDGAEDLADDFEIMRQEAFAKMRQAEEARLAVEERATFGQNLLGGLAAGVSITTEPPVLLTMIAGAPASAGLIRTVITEALIAGATETALAIPTLPIREEAGLAADFNFVANRAAEASIAGGLFAGVLGLTGRGLVRLLRRDAQTRPEVADAVAFDERLGRMLAETPFDDTGGRVHAARYTEALQGVRDGGEARLAVDPPSAPTEASYRVPSRQAAREVLAEQEEVLAAAAEEAGARVRAEAVRVARQVDALVKPVDELRAIAEELGVRFDAAVAEHLTRIINDLPRRRAIGLPPGARLSPVEVERQMVTVEEPRRRALVQEAGDTFVRRRAALDEVGPVQGFQGRAAGDEPVVVSHTGQVLQGQARVAEARAAGQDRIDIIQGFRTSGDDLADIDASAEALFREARRRGVDLRPMLRADLERAFGTTDADALTPDEIQANARAAFNAQVEARFLNADPLSDAIARETDIAREADVRAFLEENPDFAFRASTEDGGSIEVRANDILAEIEADERLVEAFNACVGK